MEELSSISKTMTQLINAIYRISLNFFIFLIAVTKSLIELGNQSKAVYVRLECKSAH